MKGLISKDFLLYGKIYGKALPFLILLFAALSLATPGLSIALCWMLTFYGLLLSHSELGCKWDLYTCALPVSRRQVVSARFLFILLLAVLGFVLGFAVGIIPVLFKGALTSELLIGCSATFLVCLAFCGISLLFNYKFGPAQARIAITILCVSPVAVLVLLQFLSSSLPLESLLFWVESHASLLLVCGAFACPVIFGACWLFSIRVRENQEL